MAEEEAYRCWRKEVFEDTLKRSKAMPEVTPAMVFHKDNIRRVKCKVKVVKSDCIDALANMAQTFPRTSGYKIGILNMASARTAGGG